METSNAPKRRVEQIGEKNVGMDFDMLTLAGAEQIYNSEFGERLNAQQIIASVIQGSVSAAMAMAYGAIRSAGEKMAFGTFAKSIFALKPLDWWMDVLADGIIALFGDTKDNPAEDGEKN